MGEFLVEKELTAGKGWREMGTFVYQHSCMGFQKGIVYHSYIAKKELVIIRKLVLENRRNCMTKNCAT